MSTEHSPVGFLEAVCFDVADIERAATFWSGLMGCTFGASTQSGFRRALLPSGLYFLLQQSDEPKTGKNRVHIDFETDEMDAAVTLVVELGGRALHTVDNGLAGFWVCADPDGNEFCIGPPESRPPREDAN